MKSYCRGFILPPEVGSMGLKTTLDFVTIKKFDSKPAPADLAFKVFESEYKLCYCHSFLQQKQEGRGGSAHL